MENQMTQREQAIWNTDFENMENHYFSRMEEFNYIRIYKSPAMAELNLCVSVNINTITQVSDRTWRISFDCRVENWYGVIQRRFQLRIHVHDESYINAWAPDDPKKDKGLGAYDLLFSQLDENELQEVCMEFIKDWGLEEQEYLASKYNL